MIELVAAMMLQTAPPVIQAPSLPGHIRNQVINCGLNYRARRMSSEGWSAEGVHVTLQVERGSCQIAAASWTPDGDVMARAVRDGLQLWSPTPVVAGWRIQVAGEPGPRIRTTFEQRDADGRVVGTLELTEPADGVTGEVSVTYRQPTP